MNNKHWVEKNETYYLFFETHDDKMCVAELHDDANGDWFMRCSSKLLSTRYIYLPSAHTLDEAKAAVENQIEQFLEEKSNYYDELLEAWKGDVA